MSRLISTYYKPGKLAKKTKYKTLGPKTSFNKDHRIVEPKETNQRVSEFATKHKSDIVKSEIWFHSLYDKYKDINDFYNKPFGKYIPDIANYRFKYIIEIDGSIHSRPDIALKDKIKDQYYKKQGYKVIRVQAYNKQDFDKMMFVLNILRGKIIKKGIKFNNQADIDTYMRTCISATPDQGLTHETQATGIVEPNTGIKS